MKLKNRFVIIILGAFVVPVLVSSLVVLFYSPSFLQYRFGITGNKALVQEIESVQSLDEIVAIAQQFPEEIFCYVFNADGDIVYHKGSVLNNVSLGKTIRKHLVFSKNIELPDGYLYSLMAGTDNNIFFMPFTGFVIMGSFILFLTILSSLTIRTINNSINQLEKGTRRIAQGDLETPIVIKGDDTFVSLANSFDLMRLKVKEEQDRQMRFFMGVSHDLKTPLASITGYSEALLDGLATDTKTQEKYVHIIHAKGKLLEQRISHLIGYIKLSNMAFRDELVERPLVPYLRDFVILQQDEANLQNYAFTADLAIDEAIRVAYDPDLLSRAMENLLQNSIRYGLPSKPVTMFCRYCDVGICLGFSNYYLQPLSPSLSEHMFEPFYRGDQARKGEGTGLGLASVKSIVDSHGWKVKGYSLLNEGKTIFEILIPLEK
ncbi:signal transduction histidine kinase [Sphaerochaeta pleomorpha str. Grapes]|uniref:histidine kinase n=1 Tax=Sphaerochaeta pleomorpha (strain ATCC BAA-1885 / DSM 22778 / Grapes) TaxID=158190 RepID=G8QX86_SPHPG|nr:HAMP domain-containing sensor histidine kinase [Sphaerochaeta pleomorpha]AEV30671.1 signal transduction histidine kinase [Sphaerochaeta pleomorpha str. Grapes]